METVQPTILIIDDQPSIRCLLAEVFEDEGYKVVVAANGYEGIQMALDIWPDIILMDMKMPGMNGLELLKEIKRHGQCHRVIVMTAYGEIETLKEVMSAGVLNYVIKPFDVRQLCSLVEKAIEDFKTKKSEFLLIG